MKNLFGLILTMALLNSVAAADGLTAIHAEGVPTAIAPSVELPKSEIPARNAKTSTTADVAPVQFAVASQFSLNTDSAGLWDFPSTTTARWRLLVQSEGAENISLHFDDYNLPASAKLMIADANNINQHGPFGALQNQLGEFWSPLIDGDMAYLELTVNTAELADVRLQLAKVNHGFLNSKEASAQQQKAATKKSGSCNIDTSCAVADPYADQIRSVARIIIDGRFLCTATLMNNTQQDGKPYLLTARHCFTGSGPFNGDLASSVVVNWNYENSGCNDGQDARTTDTQSGAILRADWGTTDMMLLELLAPPPADYQVHYAGWDRRSLNFASTTTLHHPNGSPKAISLSDNPTRVTGRFSDESGSQGYLQVQWSKGTTQTGSSGSALLSSEGRVVGQLLGGYASCDNPDEKDWYGRLHTSWNGGGAPANSLKAWLDPSNSGASVIDGAEATAPSAARSGNTAPNDSSKETTTRESNPPATTSQNNNASSNETEASRSSEKSGGGGASGLFALALLFGLFGLALKRKAQS